MANQHRILEPSLFWEGSWDGPRRYPEDGPWTYDEAQRVYVKDIPAEAMWPPQGGSSMTVTYRTAMDDDYNKICNEYEEYRMEQKLKAETQGWDKLSTTQQISRLKQAIEMARQAKMTQQKTVIPSGSRPETRPYLHPRLGYNATYDYGVDDLVILPKSGGPVLHLGQLLDQVENGGWKPIASAPKDTVVDLWVERGDKGAVLHDGYWLDRNLNYVTGRKVLGFHEPDMTDAQSYIATHWQPVPKKPK